MRKERMFAMVLLIMVLVAVVALPQGFAKTKIRTKNFGNRPQMTPIPSSTPSHAPVIPHPLGISVPQQSNGLLSYHLGALEFASPLVYV